MEALISGEHTNIRLNSILLLGGVFPVGSEMLLPSAPKISVELLAQTADSLGPLAASKFGAGPRISRAQEPAGTSNSPTLLEQSRSERAAPQWTKDCASPLRLGPGPLGPANFGGAARHLSKSKSGLRCVPAGSHRR